MIESDLLEIVDRALLAAGAILEEGEAFSTPRLEIVRYYRKPERLSPIPIVGRALQVVAVVRQPGDLVGDRGGLRTLLGRLAMAVNGRYPPRAAWVVGLLPLFLTAEPITPEDDALTRDSTAITLPPRRVLLTGLFRLNLGQEAMSFAVTRGDDNPFALAETIADALAPNLRRFVPLVEG